MSDNYMPGDNSGPGGPDAPEPNCPECDGTGVWEHRDLGDVPCKKCDGTGFLDDSYYEDDFL